MDFTYGESMSSAVIELRDNSRGGADLAIKA
jgi:hypothetical protein